MARPWRGQGWGWPVSELCPPVPHRGRCRAGAGHCARRGRDHLTDDLAPEDGRVLAHDARAEDPADSQAGALGKERRPSSAVEEEAVARRLQERLDAWRAPDGSVCRHRAYGYQLADGTAFESIPALVAARIPVPRALTAKPVRPPSISKELPWPCAPGAGTTSPPSVAGIPSEVGPAAISPWLAIFTAGLIAIRPIGTFQCETSARVIAERFTREFRYGPP